METPTSHEILSKQIPSVPNDDATTMTSEMIKTFQEAQ